MSTLRKINFGAGPAALPEEVLQMAADAVVEYSDTGLSILELPHRGKEFGAILEESKELVRELCQLNDDYEVLWLHGGGRMQFCMIPMNFLNHQESAGYIDSGHWAEDALEYATHYGSVQILATSKEDNYRHLPAWPHGVPRQLSYLHYTTNNTIYGTQWHEQYETQVPVIADMSSDIFSMRRHYSRYAMFYAAAQKNIGPAGVALVVLHKDMLQRMKRDLPPMLSYAAQVKHNSILNTANVPAIYNCLLMLRWTKNKGIDVIEKENRHKTSMLYQALENSKLFKPVVDVAAHRSLMNVCFTAKNADVEKRFLQLCDDSNITGIKGHRSVGGFRVSLYNAVPVQHVETLVQLMQQFEADQ